MSATVQAQGGVFPVAPEAQRAFRVISDEEAAGFGLPVELTEADTLREELASLRAAIASGTVRDQGMRSLPPLTTETPAEPVPPFVPWDQLPARTRAELEAGRALIGGGLPAREAYERSQNYRRPPEPMVFTPPPDPPGPAISNATQRELQAGRDLMERNAGIGQNAAVQAARLAADRLARRERPTGDELHYVAGQ